MLKYTYECDRCGAEIKQDYKSEPAPFDWMMVDDKQWSDSKCTLVGKGRLLCGSCADRYNDFMNGGSGNG
jgi:hypothetical protein